MDYPLNNVPGCSKPQRAAERGAETHTRACVHAMRACVRSGSCTMQFRGVFGEQG